MIRLINIIIILYAGVTPILLAPVIIFDYIYWLLHGEYYALFYGVPFVGGWIFYLSTAILSYMNNYCRYHINMLLCAMTICLIPYLSDLACTIFGDNLVPNLIIMALYVLVVINFIFVLVHIAKQINKHIHKTKILNGLFKRIIRPNR